MGYGKPRIGDYKWELFVVFQRIQLFHSLMFLAVSHQNDHIANKLSYETHQNKTVNIV